MMSRGEDDSRLESVVEQPPLNRAYGAFKASDSKTTIDSYFEIVSAARDVHSV